MVFINFFLKNLPKEVNPYIILGITKNTNPKETKLKFREKLIEFKNNDELRAKICLAYDIIVNKNFYIECKKDIYKINKAKKEFLSYYYTVIGDCENLIFEVESNSSLLFFKDPLQRNLLYIAARNGNVSICEYLINKGIEVNDIQSTGSTALHGAAYYGQTNVVKLLLNYGAKTNIKNNFGHLPIDEAATKEIVELLKESEKDPITKLYQSLLNKNIAKILIPIHQNGKIIAKKIICNLNNLPKEYKSSEVENNWIPAWHGTNFTCIESIAEIGLKPAGGKLKNGEEIKVCFSHIKRDKTVDKIPDWANAIFVSPSVFYAAYPAYAKEISCNNELWKVLVELRVKPDSYFQRESTCLKYIPKKDEPKMLEYRIAPKNEKDVQVVSLAFVKNEFFDKVKNFEEGKLLLKKIK